VTERKPRVGPLGIALVLLMAAGSVLMWLGAPIGWIWVAAHISGTPGSVTIGPLLLIAVALPVTMLVLLYVLRRLDLLFSEVTGYTRENRRIAVPWMTGMTEARGRKRKATVLDIVMIVSVIGAGFLAGLLWLLVKP
jgi:hypothetical protein